MYRVTVQYNTHEQSHCYFWWLVGALLVGSLTFKHAHLLAHARRDYNISIAPWLCKWRFEFGMTSGK
jgi:hypothetical protein